jgi:polygalacturonase
VRSLFGTVFTSFPSFSFRPLVFKFIMLVIMRSLLFLSTLVPLVIACDNPDNDACASAFTVSSADAATFCATYTAASQTQATDLPAYATYCSMKPKKLSSACSCLAAQTTLQTVTSVATSGVGLRVRIVEVFC